MTEKDRVRQAVADLKARKDKMTLWEEKNKWWEAFLGHAINYPNNNDWRASEDFAEGALKNYKNRFFPQEEE